eukprot:GFYU01000126.1.p1 GENE.GFYU01000126.1~~GFYU01000126.1.p1  ORF type:complete len:405 (+),score=121.07 GFYU01000126.1:129-1343(+)
MPILTGIVGGLTMVGGAIGGMKGSMHSLAGGVLLGGGLIGASVMMTQGQEPAGRRLAIGLSGVLAAVMGSRFASSQKPMPGAVTAAGLLSFAWNAAMTSDSGDDALWFIIVACCVCSAVFAAMYLQQGTQPSSKKPHVKARTDHPDYLKAKIKRAEVPDDKVSWSVSWPEYNPPDYVADVVKKFNVKVMKNGWADPEDPKETIDMPIGQRFSYEQKPLTLDKNSRPINPRGRTGLCNRGLLGRWGPNHAADPIVTRYHPETGVVQFVGIRRKDNGQWALPGGMVDPGEAVSVTLRREFEEEAGNVPESEREAFKEQLDELFKGSGRNVYQGYVDDPRNTDNAWMETNAVHFHCPPKLAAMLNLHAGDDAAEVKWISTDGSDPDYNNLYASHNDFINAALKHVKK